MRDTAPRAARSRLPVEWLGILPFVAFALLFLILPTMKIVVGAFQSPDGSFTLQNLIDLNTDSIRNAYWTSIKLSLITALMGCAIGFAMASAAGPRPTDCCWAPSASAPWPAGWRSPGCPAGSRTK